MATTVPATSSANTPEVEQLPTGTPTATPNTDADEPDNSSDQGQAQQELPEDPDVTSGTAENQADVVPEGSVLSTLPECAGHLFTVPPVDLNEVYEITPLGNIGPPGHTVPTEHMYFHISAGGVSNRKVPLSAPGEIYILQVSGGEDVSQGEFFMIFALCRDVFGYFGHIKELSDELKGVLAGIECEQWTTNPGNICARNLFLKVAPGTVLGSVGDLQGNFDFGAFDYRTKLEYANPWQYGDPEASGFNRPRSLHIVCPLDLYEIEIRTELYDKLPRTAAPECGQVMQDKAGTLQGNWFLAGATGGSGDNAVFFGYDNFDPSLGIVSVGGVFTEPGKMEFTPRGSGLRNRRFDEVTVDGQVYCYERDGTGRSESYTEPGSLLEGHVLVRLNHDTEIQIEHQAGGCPANPGLRNPSIYTR